eukprot:SAG11_NODE_12580_length_696_cov_0.989950_1_plen_174_part_01
MADTADEPRKLTRKEQKALAAAKKASSTSNATDVESSEKQPSTQLVKGSRRERRAQEQAKRKSDLAVAAKRLEEEQAEAKKQKRLAKRQREKDRKRGVVDPLADETLDVEAKADLVIAKAEGSLDAPTAPPTGAQGARKFAKPRSAEFLKAAPFGLNAQVCLRRARGGGGGGGG